MSAPTWLGQPRELVWAEPTEPAPPRALEIWRIDLDASRRNPQELATLLSREERMRATRFRFDRDRWRYIRSHAALRSILARRLGTVPAALEIESDDHGKPYLAGPVAGLLPAFNLTHAGQLALVVVAAAECGRSIDFGIGIDTEEIARSRIEEHLLAGSLTARERAVWDALPEACRALWFFALWTRKEASIKADGRGLGIGPTTLEAFADRGSPWDWGHLTVPAAARHAVISFVPRPGYVASLAAPPGEYAVTARPWPPRDA